MSGLSRSVDPIISWRRPCRQDVTTHRTATTLHSLSPAPTGPTAQPRIYIRDLCGRLFGRTIADKNLVSKARASTGGMSCMQERRLCGENRCVACDRASTCRATGRGRALLGIEQTATVHRRRRAQRVGLSLLAALTPSQSFVSRLLA